MTRVDTLKIQVREAGRELGHHLPRFASYPPPPTEAEQVRLARLGVEQPEPHTFRARCPLCDAMAIIMPAETPQTGGSALRQRCKRNVYATVEAWLAARRGEEAEAEA